MTTPTVDLMVKCAWCGQIQGGPPKSFITNPRRSDKDESMVTHTICPSCKAEQFRLLEEFEPGPI